MKFAALAAALSLAAGLAAPAAADGTRVVVPIRRTVLPDGVVRYSVPVSVGGGAPIDALLDTGSFGLRVLSSALSPDQYRATDTERRFSYGSGALLSGPIAAAAVRVGEAETAAPIDFQLVRSVGCTERMPSCAAGTVSAEHYGIGGDGLPDQGFKAILGTSLMRAPAEVAANNPLPELVDSSYLVVLPRAGDDASGELILNPAPEEAAGFALFRLEPQADAGFGGAPGWKDARLPGCATQDRGRPTCAPTLLDTGAPGLTILTSGTKQRAPLGPGHAMAVDFARDGAHATARFTTDGSTASGVTTGPPRGDVGPRIVAGTAVFDAFSVLYDVRAGTIGLKPR